MARKGVFPIVATLAVVCVVLANGLLYIEKERKSRYQRIDEAEKAAFAKGEAEGKEDKLIATVRELEEKQALREEQESKLYYEALSHTVSFKSTRTEWGTGKRQNEYEHSKNRNGIRRNAGSQRQNSFRLR